MTGAAQILQKAMEARGATWQSWLCDWQIRALAVAGMIQPYVPEQVRYTDRSVATMTRAMSFGQGPAGYDARLDIHFKKLPAVSGDDHMLDPKGPPLHYEQFTVADGPLLVPPRGIVSGVTMESFDMPADVQGFCLQKSSYFRLGLMTQVTGLEPGWHGTLTVQMVNLTDRTFLVWPGEGILQLAFALTSGPEQTYDGAYQGQQGVVTGSTGTERR